MSRHGFLWVCPIGVHWDSWIFRLMYYQIWEIFRYYLFNFFKKITPFLFFWDWTDMNIRPFIIFPLITEYLLIFSILVSLCCLICIISTDKSLHQTLPCHLHYAIEPTQWVFYFSCCIFSAKISIRSFFIFSVFLFRLSSLCFKRICHCLLKHFYNNCFKFYQIIWTYMSSWHWCLLIALLHMSWINLVLHMPSNFDWSLEIVTY